MKFSKISKEHLEKARDSALLAVEFYNKPAVRFKTAGYITMMSIAWTSLMHAIFFKRRQKPFYKDNKGRFETREGDYRYWELSTCIREYFGARESPIKANLKFFIPLRNRIEHRSLPQLDPTIFGECQSLLFNFDSILEKEFGPKHALREMLSFSLQIFPRGPSIDLEKPAIDEKEIVDFIKSYRSSLSADVYADSKYAFKAFLIRVSNNNTLDSVPIRFIDFDQLSPEEQKDTAKVIAFTRSKHVSVSNIDLYKPSQVVQEVQQRIGNLKIRRRSAFGCEAKLVSNRFTGNTHTLFWKKYKVRPENGAKSPERTDTAYCIYDKLNRNYGYSEKWIDRLVKATLDDVEYLSLFKDPDLIVIPESAVVDEGSPDEQALEK